MYARTSRTIFANVRVRLKMFAYGRVPREAVNEPLPFHPDEVRAKIKWPNSGCWQPRGSQMAKTPLEIASLARMHTKKAVKTLAAIMNEPHAPYAARVAAAEALLDRGWGKPRQSHEAEITHRYVIEIPALMDNATWEAEALEPEPESCNDGPPRGFAFG